MLVFQVISRCALTDEIQNWFQNRRAKRKQEKKQEAYEAGQAQDALGQYSEPSSPDFNYGNGYYNDSHGHILAVQQPTASFSLATGPPPPVAPYNPQYSDPSTASMESLHRTLAAAQAASEHDEYHNFVDHDSLTQFGGSSLVHDSANSDRAHFPSPEESIIHYDGSQYAYSSSAFAGNLYNNSCQNELHSPPQEHHTPTLFSAYPSSSEVEVSAPQLVPTFPSQLLTQFDGLPEQTDGNNGDSQSPENGSVSTLAVGFHDIAESDESSTSPPAPSNPFRSPPPPMDIASRRKKVQHKPAALTADTMRSRPPMGPRTVSHAEGFRRPMDSPVSSPMRRIVSAGGNRIVLSGRVYKSGVESAQRSPIHLGSFADAGAFMEQNCHTIRLPPSLTAGSSLNSSLAPPTPMSPREREMTLVKRETSRSTASPNEGSMNFVFNAGTGGFTTMEGDQNLASPPETPQAQMVMHPSNNWPTMEFSEKQWTFEVPDEPLFTPAHETFPELHVPQPAYLTSMSQPVTPAFGQFNPNFMFSDIDGNSPQYTLSTQPHSEYAFPDAHHYMSPSMTKQKTFQFSHTTPADFSEK